MEQRTFLAIGLSLLILFIYSSIVTKNAPPSFQENISEHIDNERVVSHKEQEENSALSPLSVIIPNPEEQIDSIASPALELEFSNIGANIHTIKISKYDFSLPITGVFNLKGFENTPFSVSHKTKGEIVYFYEDSNVSIEKYFKIEDREEFVSATVKINNKSEMSKEQSFVLSNYTLDNSRLDKIYANDEKMLLEYSISTLASSNTSGTLINKIFRKGDAVKFSEKERTDKTSLVNWVGFRDRYFCAIFKPDFESEGYQVNPLGATAVEINTKTKTVQLLPGESVSFNWTAYFGPQDLNLLKSFKNSFEEIVSFSSIGLFDFVAKGIYAFLGGVHKIVPNWGICIILISFGIYMALYPLTMKGMLSMKKMQSLQPKISKLKEQYPNNPQKLNKETMELYREYKVNPFGGCLPFLLQMPVFIGLYQVLWRSIYLKGSDFLWIKDLSAPDRLFILPFSLPFLGNEFNILPILMAVVMFFQQKITSQNMVYSDPKMATQQKMMTTMLPIFLGFVFYKFSSGLSLYFITFYLLSTLTQLKMSKVKVINNA